MAESEIEQRISRLEAVAAALIRKTQRDMLGLTPPNSDSIAAKQTFERDKLWRVGVTLKRKDFDRFGSEVLYDMVRFQWVAPKENGWVVLASDAEPLGTVTTDPAAE